MHAMRICNGCTCLIHAAPFWFTGPPAAMSQKGLAQPQGVGVVPCGGSAPADRWTGTGPMRGEVWMGPDTHGCLLDRMDVDPRAGGGSGQSGWGWRGRKDPNQAHAKIVVTCVTGSLRNGRRAGGADAGPKLVEEAGPHAKTRRTRRDGFPGSPRPPRGPAVIPDSGMWGTPGTADADIRHHTSRVARTRKAPPDRGPAGLPRAAVVTTAVLRPPHVRRHPLSTR
jgi:hypothetical protein